MTVKSPACPRKKSAANRLPGDKAIGPTDMLRTTQYRKHKALYDERRGYGIIPPHSTRFPLAFHPLFGKNIRKGCIEVYIGEVA